MITPKACRERRYEKSIDWCKAISKYIDDALVNSEEDVTVIKNPNKVWVFADGYTYSPFDEHWVLNDLLADYRMNGWDVLVNRGWFGGVKSFVFKESDPDPRHN